MRRLFLLLIMLLGVVPAIRAADGELEAFKAATNALADKFFERAEQQLAEFRNQFPDSTNLASAVLFQAQARFHQKRWDEAIELLRSNAEKAGGLADEYLLWQGEALVEKGDFAGAGATFEKLLQDFPQSPLRLQAAYSQAFATFQQKDFPKAIELLRSPEGAFQTSAQEKAGTPVAFKGRLLLAEALLAANQRDEARSVAAALTAPEGRPDLAWEKHQFLGQLELSGGTPQEALQSLTNAIAAAEAAGQQRLQAQSLSLEADVYKKLNQPEKAAASYDKVIALDKLAIDQRRLALLKGIELLSTGGKLTNAIDRLESYLQVNTNEPSADLLRLKASELWLDQFRLAAAGKPNKWGVPQQAMATNAVAQARRHLQVVFNTLTNSTHVGKAWLNLGWTYWEEGTAFEDPKRLAESEEPFRNATERLTRSDDQALARHKLGEAQFVQGKYAAALTNFTMVLTAYGDLPQVKNSLFGRSYQQTIRTAIELNDLGTAAAYLEKMRQDAPKSTLTEETVFLYGRALLQRGKAAEARAIFEEFVKSYPDSALLPSVKFAEARTFKAEGNWDKAIALHELWLAAHTNSPLRAEVEFHRATLYGKAGNQTNALSLFTNYVSQFGNHPLAPAAQNWVADYFYERGDWIQAEKNYIQLFQNTNWAGSSLTYHARKMAARTAFFRQGYDDARGYLTNIIQAFAQDAKAPPDLLPEAFFMLGDVLVELPITGTTNQLNNYLEAAKVYDLITRQYTNWSGLPLAWGKKGDCHLQLASVYPQSYAEATNAYRKVLEWNGGQAPVQAINQAQVGLAMTLERMAESKPSSEKEPFLRAALGQLLNLVYGNGLAGRKPDPFYLKKAGQAAGRLAEELGEREAALQLYKRLLLEVPSLKSTWEGRIQALTQRASLD